MVESKECCRERSEERRLPQVRLAASVSEECLLWIEIVNQGERLEVVSCLQRIAITVSRHCSIFVLFRKAWTRAEWLTYRMVELPLRGNEATVRPRNPRMTPSERSAQHDGRVVDDGDSSATGLAVVESQA